MSEMFSAIETIGIILLWETIKNFPRWVSEGITNKMWLDTLKKRNKIMGFKEEIKK
jgi:hypothetical protein